MTKLSTDSYKGARDFYPEDMRVRNYIFSKWRKVMQRYGYEAYDTPLLESLEIYAAKSGDELVNEQTYQFTDRGDRKVVIRPELTPSTSRMIAARRQEIAYPARWYNIGRFMRYERPQRGREREFWQMNVDLFGDDSVASDAEIIAIGDTLLKELNAKPDMYKIRINNRSIINTMMAKYLELDTVQAQLMMVLFDRKGKISNEAFRDQAIEIFGDQKAKNGLRKISQLLAAKNMSDLPEEIRDTKAVQNIQKLFTQLEKRGVTNASFDISLMRGLDYYTGTVFEFFDTHPENKRALFGGGRYDGLIGLFGVEPVSAVGFAPGYTTTELFLQSHNLLPELTSTTDVYAVIVGDAAVGARDVVRELRDEGVNVEEDLTSRKIDKQLKTAVKKGIRYVLFIGEDDLKDKQFNLKNLKSGDEEKLSVERVVAKLKDKRTRVIDDEADDDFALPSDE